MLKRSKIGQKLHEFIRIWTILEIVKMNSKIINWGGHKKLKCLEKNANFGNYPSPHNYGPESKPLNSRNSYLVGSLKKCAGHIC